VRTFFVVVRQVLAHKLSEMRLPQRDHAVETFIFDRTVESFHERIQVRAAPGQANRLDSCAFSLIARALTLPRAMHIYREGHRLVVNG